MTTRMKTRMSSRYLDIAETLPCFCYLFGRRQWGDLCSSTSGAVSACMKREQAEIGGT